MWRYITKLLVALSGNQRSTFGYPTGRNGCPGQPGNRLCETLYIHTNIYIYIYINSFSGNDNLFTLMCNETRSVSYVTDSFIRSTTLISMTTPTTTRSTTTTTTAKTESASSTPAPKSAQQLTLNSPQAGRASGCAGEQRAVVALVVVVALLVLALVVIGALCVWLYVRYRKLIDTPQQDFSEHTYENCK